MKKVVIVCLLAAAVSMAQRQSVVVLPSIADQDAKLSPRQLDLLTDKVRSIIPNILPLKDFNLLKQGVVEERLGEEGLYLACKEGSCVGDLVAQVQADFGARCEVLSVNKQLYLKFELYGTLKGERDAGTIDQFNDLVKDFAAMLALLDKKVPVAFKKIIVESAAPPPAAPAKPVAPAAAPAAGGTKNNAEAYFKRGVKYFEKGDHDWAISDFTQAMRLNPNYAEAYSKRGMAYGNKGDYDRAISDFTEAILLNPKNAEAYYNRGLTHSIKGNNDEAIADYKSALRIDPNHSGVQKALESITAPPPAAVESEEESDEEVKRRIFSWGIRTGFNFSHLYATYDNGYVNTSGTYKSTPGFQLGLVFDWALTDWFHLQPNIMYIQKGTEDYDGGVLTLHNFELSLLLSLKFSALRINAGPYLGVEDYPDFGLSAGFGFDVGWLYVGVFYDYGLIGSYYYDGYFSHLKAYNRTLGLNLGVNL